MTTKSITCISIGNFGFQVPCFNNKTILILILGRLRGFLDILERKTLIDEFLDPGFKILQIGGNEQGGLVDNIRAKLKR
jgi:hypothetical protein